MGCNFIFLSSLQLASKFNVPITKCFSFWGFRPHTSACASYLDPTGGLPPNPLTWRTTFKSDPSRLHGIVSHACLYPQPQRIIAHWPVLISRPAEDRRLSWPGWLGEILRRFTRPKTVTH